MTQFSLPWGCTDTGDGGPDSYSLDVVYWTNMLLGNAVPASDGLIYWKSSLVPPFSGFVNAVNGLLEPTNPSGSVVRIASGAGMVQGWLYLNDDDVDFDIASDLGNASATDLIVLERVAASQTVRLARVKGGAGSTATVTQSTATWQVAIAEVVLDGGGDFSSINDIRTLAHSPTDAMVKIAEENDHDGTADTVTFDNIPPFFRDLRVVVFGRSDVNANFETFSMRFNNVQGTDYDYLIFHRDGDGSESDSYSPGTSGLFLGFIPGATSPANYAGQAIVEILNYRTSLAKTINVQGFYKLDTSSADINYVRGGGHWNDTDPITRIDIFLLGGDFVAGSRVALFGIL